MVNNSQLKGRRVIASDSLAVSVRAFVRSFVTYHFVVTYSANVPKQMDRKKQADV